MDRIVIVINQIWFIFNSMTCYTKSAFCYQRKRDQLIRRMSLDTSANLGLIRDRWALKKNEFSEERVINYKGLIVTRRMETDYCITHNILGVNSTQKVWHYTISTATSNDENML